LRPLLASADGGHVLVQSTAAGKAWDLASLPTDQKDHISNDQLVGIMFQRPAARGDDKVVQATEFCERFLDNGQSLGMFAADAHEEWSIKIKTWQTHPVLYPYQYNSYSGRYVNGVWKQASELKDPDVWPQVHRYRTWSTTADGTRAWVYSTPSSPDFAAHWLFDNAVVYTGSGKGIFFEPIKNGFSHPTSVNSTQNLMLTMNREDLHFRSIWGYNDWHASWRFPALSPGPVTCRYNQNEGANIVVYVTTIGQCVGSASRSMMLFSEHCGHL
jgi:hypothetical protein